MQHKELTEIIMGCAYPVFNTMVKMDAVVFYRQRVLNPERKMF